MNNIPPSNALHHLSIKFSLSQDAFYSISPDPYYSFDVIQESRCPGNQDARLPWILRILFS
jgi:hypothetical protein